LARDGGVDRSRRSKGESKGKGKGQGKSKSKGKGRARARARARAEGREEAPSDAGGRAAPQAQEGIADEGPDGV
jgi:hypothetical protein